jgi:hypothetical protein
MIDERYIESARQIRNQYLKVSDDLNSQRGKLQSLANYLIEQGNELKNFKTTNKDIVKSKESLIEASNKLFSKIAEIEEKEKSMSKEIKELEKKMGDLKLEEFNLLKKIQEKYPNLSNQEIRNEVHSRL